VVGGGGGLTAKKKKQLRFFFLLNKQIEIPPSAKKYIYFALFANFPSTPVMILMPFTPYFKQK
jgi:hypothetical protein